MTKGLLVGLALSALVLSRPTKATPPKSAKLNPSTGRPIVTQGTVRLSESELAELLEKHGFENIEKATAIVNRESGRYTDVSVDTRGMSAEQLQSYWHIKAMPEWSVGLWQINLLANQGLVPGATLEEKATALKDPDVSAVVAFKLSKGGTNWGPWGG